MDTNLDPRFSVWRLVAEARILRDPIAAKFASYGVSSHVDERTDHKEQTDPLQCVRAVADSAAQLL